MLLFFFFLLEGYFDQKKKKKGSESLEGEQSADPRGVSFSPSCDSSCRLSYFLRTFIVNLPINILVSLVLCFLKGIGVCFFVYVTFILFSFLYGTVRSGPLRSRPKAGLNMCGCF